MWTVRPIARGAISVQADMLTDTQSDFINAWEQGDSDWGTQIRDSTESPSSESAWVS